MKHIEAEKLPIMSKYQLAWWRIKDFFAKKSTEAITIDITDSELLLQACHEHNMSLNEFVSYLMEWYIKTNPLPLKDYVEEEKHPLVEKVPEIPVKKIRTKKTKEI